MGGVRILPDIALDELRPQDSAMLILAGGDTWGEDSMAGFRAAARRFLGGRACRSPRSAARRSAWPWKGCSTTARTPATPPSTSRSPATQGGDRYVDEPAVTDGDLITATGVAPAHFARAIFDRLGIYTPEVAASWFKLYGDRDPAGFFELMAVSAASSAQSPA